VDTYSNASAFTRSVKALLATGAKPILIHFPSIQEIGQRKEFDWESARINLDRGKKFVKEIEEALGVKTIGLIPYFPKNIENLLSYFADGHPNARGNELYADALVRALLDLPSIKERLRQPRN